jgi:hypothetical protein
MTICVRYGTGVAVMNDHPFYRVNMARRYAMILGIFAPDEKLTAADINSRLGDQISIYSLRRSLMVLLKEGRILRKMAYTGTANVYHYEVVDAKR